MKMAYEDSDLEECNEIKAQIASEKSLAKGKAKSAEVLLNHSKKLRMSDGTLQEKKELLEKAEQLALDAINHEENMNNLKKEARKRACKI